MIWPLPRQVDLSDLKETVRGWLVHHLNMSVNTKMHREQPLPDKLEVIAKYMNCRCLNVGTPHESARIRNIFHASDKAKDKQAELHNFVMQLIRAFVDLKQFPVPAVFSSVELKKLWPPK